jgi:hypothetical protein
MPKQDVKLVAADRVETDAKEMSDDFRQSVREIAASRAERDRDTGISPADRLLPRQRHWQEVHRLKRKFETDVREMIAQVVSSANVELSPHGFRLQEVRTLRLLPGEITGAAFLIASQSGIEPNGTLTFKLRDTGRIRIEAEGLALRIHHDGADHDSLEASPDGIDRAAVEAAFLSFIREVLAGAQHAFSDD